jgi:hypothetical protein
MIIESLFLDGVAGRALKETGLQFTSDPANTDGELIIQSACRLEDYTGVPTKSVGCLYSMGLRRPKEPESGDNPYVFLLFDYEEEDLPENQDRFKEDLDTLEKRLKAHGLKSTMVYFVVVYGPCVEPRAGGPLL